MSDVKLGLLTINSDYEGQQQLSVTRSDLERCFWKSSIRSAYWRNDEFILCLWKCCDISSTAKGAGLLTVARVIEDFGPDNNKLCTRSITTNGAWLDATTSAKLNLYCSAEYCKFYGYVNHEEFLIRLCEMISPVEQVIIGAKTKTAFQLASHRDFSANARGLLSKHTILVRQGMQLNWPSLCSEQEILKQLIVLSCSPVQQGCLTEHTEIVVKEISLLDSDRFCKPDTQTDSIQPLLISDFAADSQRWHSPFHTLQTINSTKHLSSHSGINSFGIKLMVNTIFDVNKLQTFVSKCRSYKDGLDECATVLLSKHDAAKFGIFNGSVLEMKLCSSDTKLVTSGCRKRNRIHNGKVVVALVDDSSTSSSDGNLTVHSLPCVWFNACKLSSTTSHSWSRASLSFTIEKLKEKARQGQSSSLTLSYQDLPHASEAVVSCIHSPHYSSTGSHDKLLQQHFATSRLLQVGDTFGISVDSDPTYFESLPIDGVCSREPVIYFKVKKLTVAGPVCCACLVDSTRTSLLMESPVHDYVPVDMHLVGSHRRWLKTPAFLHSYIEQILQILNPFLTDRAAFGSFQPLVLVVGPKGCGKTSLCLGVAARLGMHHYTVNCHSLCADTSAATEAKIRQCITTAMSCRPCLWLLQDIDVLCKDREGHDDSRVAAMFQNAVTRLLDDCHDWPVIVMATTVSLRHVSLDIHNIFAHCVEVENPDELTRRQILQELVTNDSLSADVSLQQIAQSSAGFVLSDLSLLVSHTQQSAYRRQLQVFDTRRELRRDAEYDLCVSGVQLQASDFDSALGTMHSSQSDAIGAPKIPRVTWDDVGGLVEVKKDILDTIQLPLQHPQLLACGLRRSGILLYGPPGTGKTLLAKAVATECSLNFLSVKGPELLNMYVGQSEENVREVFQRARTATPCVIFFDELDSLAPNRGRSGDSGGVMDRVVSQLLAEIDGLNKSSDVFVIGATNRPDLLDPALLRPGRFDKLVYLGVSQDKDSQLKIIRALTRKFRLSADCNLENIVEKCSLNMTGADFYALCSDAMLNAMVRAITLIDSGKLCEDDGVTVDEEDFYCALSKLVPSLSNAELKRYDQLKQQFSSAQHTSMTVDRTMAQLTL